MPPTQRPNLFTRAMKERFHQFANREQIDRSGGIFADSAVVRQYVSHLINHFTRPLSRRPLKHRMRELTDALGVDVIYRDTFSGQDIYPTWPHIIGESVRTCVLQGNRGWGVASLNLTDQDYPELHVRRRVADLLTDLGITIAKE